MVGNFVQSRRFERRILPRSNVRRIESWKFDGWKAFGICIVRNFARRLRMKKTGIRHLRLESWESRIFRIYKVAEFRQAGISLRFSNLQGKIANLRFDVRQVTKCES